MSKANIERLLDNPNIPDETKRRLRNETLVHDGLLAAGSTALGTRQEEPRRPSRDELLEEYRETKERERELLEEIERAESERAEKSAPLKSLLGRLDTSHVSKDTLRRLKSPALVREHEDGSVSFEHDRQIKDDGRIASR